MLFISNFARHKIGLQPQRKRVDNFGNVITIPGIRCDFVDYRYETDNKEIIKGLKAHPRFGIDFRSADSVEPNEEGLVAKKSEENSIATLLTSCPQCAFKAKTEGGLRLHILNKHEKAISESEQ